MTDIYKELQDARRAHRHAAHVYARTPNTKANKPAYDAAVAELEKAALVMALLAAQWGLHAGCAAPAHPARTKWERDTDPNPKQIPKGLRSVRKASR